MRRRYIVCYDISDPARLRRVFRKMLGYGDPLQKSVFTCDLSPNEKARMIKALSKIIDLDADSVMVVDTGALDAKRESLEYLGRDILPEEGRAAIIV